MKILENYKKIAHELLFEEKEIDDEKMIKYKDEDGESKEMRAGSAKSMPMFHPAKIAYEKERGFYKMGDAGKGSGAEKEKGQKIGGSDFGRDSGDAKSSEPKAGGDDKPADDSKSRNKARMEKEYGIEIPDGTPEDDLYDDDVAYKIVDTLAKKFDISKEYAMFTADDELAGEYHDSYYSLADSLENNFQEMTDEGGHQKYDEPAYDTQGMEKMKYGGDGYPDLDPDKDDDSDDKYAGLEGYKLSTAKDADEEIAKYRASGKMRGRTLPISTDFRTKIDDLDEDDVDAFYDAVAEKYAEKYDITMGVFDDNKEYFMDEEGKTMRDLVLTIKSSAEEAAEEGGYMGYGESVKPKKKPFLREQLERFGGGKY